MSCHIKSRPVPSCPEPSPDEALAPPLPGLTAKSKSNRVEAGPYLLSSTVRMTSPRIDADDLFPNDNRPNDKPTTCRRTSRVGGGDFPSCLTISAGPAPKQEQDRKA